MIETWRSNPLRLLLAAGGFAQAFFCLAIYLLGVLKIFPSQIFAGGVFFGDAQWYLEKSASLSGRLFAGDFSFLFTPNEQIHLRLYSVSYALLAPVFGHNILSFELINLPLFLLTLFFVYKIGETCFGEKTARRATALIVLLLPSLAAHYTQPLRDPLFITLFLAFFFLVLKIIKSPLNPSKAAALAGVAVSVCFVLWLVRDNMLLIYLAVISFAVFLTIVGNWRNLSRVKYNCAALFVLLLALVLIPKNFSRLIPDKEPLPLAKEEQLKIFQERLKEKNAPSYLIALDSMRYKFSLYDDVGSNVDADVYFETPPDLILYLPRAALVGMYSPFPNMWLDAGRNSGRIGRVAAGVETALIYLLGVFAAVTMAKNLRSVLVWQIILTISAAAVALGLVVINVGALYRMRYVFWILFIIVATEGIVFLNFFKPKAASPGEVSAS